MHINYDKTNYMILGRTNKHNVSQEFDIRMHHMLSVQRMERPRDWKHVDGSDFIPPLHMGNTLALFS